MTRHLGPDRNGGDALGHEIPNFLGKPQGRYNNLSHLNIGLPFTPSLI